MIILLLIFTFLFYHQNADACGTYSVVKGSESICVGFLSGCPSCTLLYIDRGAGVTQMYCGDGNTFGSCKFVGTYCTSPRVGKITGGVYSCLCNNNLNYEAATKSCVANCPSGMSDPATQECVGCPEGKESIKGSCVPTCTVRDPDTLECLACPVNQESVNGTCVPVCPSGMRNPDTNECINPCGEGTELVDGNCESVCPGGKTRDPETKQCTDSCPSGSELIGGNCLPNCPEGTTRNSTTFECACPPFKELVDGVCTPIDTDKDGIPNTEDPDDDNDGIADTEDDDDDGDGILDDDEDDDLDGIKNSEDDDDDGDGILDSEDKNPGNPIPPTSNDDTIDNYEYSTYFSEFYTKLSRIPILNVPKFTCTNNQNCPEFKFTLGRLGTFSTSVHCQLMQIIFPSISAFLMLLASVIAIRVLMSA